MTNHEKLMEYFRDYESPRHFLTWDWLYMISSCLGRKVWFQTGAPVFPNIYVVIVGPPAVGKSMPARKLGDALAKLTKIEPDGKIKDLVNIVPECVTLEKLYDVIEKSTDVVPPNPETKAKPYVHASVSFLLAEEMGLLFKKNDKMSDLILFLNAGYDCTSKFRYETKRNGSNIINNMCVSFFGCCTTDWIARNISSSVIDDGWSSRVFFIYGDTRHQLTSFYKFSPDQDQYLNDLKKHCEKIAKISGEVTFSKEAEDYFHEWYQNRQTKERINKDPKLDNYYSRKKLHIWKLAMLLHFSEHTDMVITLEDMIGAFKIAADAEMNMHKALASINTNPVARLAESIVASIKSSQQGMTWVEIIHRHFNDVQVGGMNSLMEARDYLILTGRIKSDGNKFVLPKTNPAPGFVDVQETL